MRRVVSVSIPEYTVQRQPDYVGVGAKVDECVEAHFPDGEYVARAIGLDDHPGMHIDELVEIIETTGTDKYSSDRESVGDFADYDFDIHGSRFEIREGRILPQAEVVPSFFGDFVYHFFEHAPIDRGYPVRIDLLLIYDRTGLAPGAKKEPHLPGVPARFERHLYKFTNSERPGAALVGLVKILRE